MVFTSWFPQEINTPDLQLRKGSGSETRVHVAKAEIAKLFEYFTTSPVMLVRVDYLPLDLKGQFVLKLFDQCYPTEFRKDEHIALWTPEAELRYGRAVLDRSLSDLMNKLQTIEQFSEEDEDKDWILPNMKHMCSTISGLFTRWRQGFMTR